jgi:hypothetical protein
MPPTTTPSLTLADLHAAGAEVSGHADAWDHLLAEQGAERVLSALEWALALPRDPDDRPTPLELRRHLGCLTVPDEPPRVATSPITAAALLDYLRSGEGASRSTAEIRQALGLATNADWKRAQYILGRLARQGTVIGSGRTNDRRYGLVRRPAKAPAPAAVQAAPLPAPTPVQPAETNVVPQLSTLAAQLRAVRSILTAHQAAVSARLDDIAPQILAKAYALVGLEA